MNSPIVNIRELDLDIIYYIYILDFTQILMTVSFHLLWILGN